MLMTVHGDDVYTVEDFLALADDPRFENLRVELIDGELIMSPEAGITHQRIAKRLIIALDEHVVAQDLGEVFLPVNVILGEIDCPIPDVVFVSKARSTIVDASENCRGAPDLAVEVLSPGSKKRDRVKKRALYARSGIAHYWIVDPAAKEILELVLEGEAYVERSRSTAPGYLEPALFPGLTLDLRKIFP